MTQVRETDVERLPHFDGEGTPWHWWIIADGMQRFKGEGRWLQLPDEIGARLDAHEKLVDHVEHLIALFEMWRDGIFAEQGIKWVEEPPAIKASRALLREVRE